MEEIYYHLYELLDSPHVRKNVDDDTLQTISEELQYGKLNPYKFVNVLYDELNPLQRAVSARDLKAIKKHVINRRQFAGQQADIIAVLFNTFDKLCAVEQREIWEQVEHLIDVVVKFKAELDK